MIKKIKETVAMFKGLHNQTFVSASRDLDEELQELKEDVSRLYVASYPGINPSPTLFTFFGRKPNSKYSQECDLLQECKEITLLIIC